MPQEYGAIYPQEGDTGADAPAGYVTMWADFFGDCQVNLSECDRDDHIGDHCCPPGLTRWTIEWKKLNNTQLWVLRMMLTRMNRKARPVVREKSGCCPVGDI
ncbi:hypothetical protein HanHA300_Chr01g0004531 [Helianthus annuus]|nr:hypothetical protein HanHA300_Chr01g0004531 [Helianthus annuus]